MSWLGLLLLGYLTLVVEPALALPSWLTPDLLLALIVAWVIAAPKSARVSGAAILAALGDLSGSGRFGLGVAAAVVVATLLGQLRGSDLVHDLVRRSGLAIAGVLALGLALALTEYLALPADVATAGVFRAAVTGSLATSVAALLFVELLARLYRRSWQCEVGF